MALLLSFTGHMANFMKDGGTVHYSFKIKKTTFELLNSNPFLHSVHLVHKISQLTSVRLFAQSEK